MLFKKFIVSLYENEIPIENRTYKNCPKYATGKFKIPFQQWLGLKGNGTQGHDGKFYGWTHRGIAGFGVGDEISADSMAHKDYKWNDEKNKDNIKPYKLKTEKEAKEHAIRFMKAIS